MPRKTNQQLLELIAETEGFESTLELLQDAALDSVVPGICPSCESVEPCEPDATHNHCDECGTYTISSCLILAGLI